MQEMKNMQMMKNMTRKPTMSPAHLLRVPDSCVMAWTLHHYTCALGNMYACIQCHAWWAGTLVISVHFRVE